jgi:hypothetical protein
MHQHYQQFDLQTLIDLLAKETQAYTKAFIGGRLQDGEQHRATIDALIEEIQIRKRGALLPGANKNDFSMRIDFPCC